MNIVCLLGSPRRKGNSALLAQHFLRCAEQLGASVQSYHLNDLELSGCQACEACKRGHDHCVLQDDLTEPLEAVTRADAVVLASPVYYGDVSAQLKAFIDRTYSYLKPGYIALKRPSRLARPKPLVFILAQGHRDPDWFADILPRYGKLFRWTGFAEVFPLRAIDIYHPGEINQRQDLLDEAEELARLLLNDALTSDAPEE